MPLLIALLLAQSSIESRLRDALKSANAQLQTLQDEQAQWQGKEAKYKRELDALKADLAAAKKNATVKIVRRGDDEKLKEATASLDQCKKDVEAAQKESQAHQDARALLAGKLDGLTSRAASCEAKNAKMYRVGQDILDWLQKLGAGAAIAAREPFLGLKRVELENAAQDFQDKLLDQRVTTRAQEAR